jgi:protein N-terminal methyltransferase
MALKFSDWRACNADDAVAFFDRCKAGLKPGGIIVVKENICKHTEFVVDKEDSSLTRSNKYMLQLFAKSKMLVLYNVLQRNFPKELFPVRMYAIKPRTVTAEISQNWTAAAAIRQDAV